MTSYTVESALEHLRNTIREENLSEFECDRGPRKYAKDLLDGLDLSEQGVIGFANYYKGNTEKETERIRVEIIKFLRHVVSSASNEMPRFNSIVKWVESNLSNGRKDS